MLGEGGVAETKKFSCSNILAGFHLGIWLGENNYLGGFRLYCTISLLPYVRGRYQFFHALDGQFKERNLGHTFDAELCVFSPVAQTFLPKICNP